MTLILILIWPPGNMQKNIPNYAGEIANYAGGKGKLQIMQNKKESNKSLSKLFHCFLLTLYLHLTNSQQTST